MSAPQIIFDANNFLRRRFETGASVRTCFTEICAWPGPVVFDGANALSRRRKTYAGYKAGRPTTPTDITAQLELMQQLLAFAPVPVIRVPGWEADDVIATLVRLTNEQVHIRSTDADFLQLPNVTLDRERPFHCEPRWVRVFKSSVGDPSDNIPGLRLFGKGSWGKLDHQDKTQLEQFLAGTINCPPDNLPRSTFNWLDDDPDNVALVRSFYEITQLYDVPMSEIAEHTVMGERRPELAEKIFREFML